MIKKEYRIDGCCFCNPIRIAVVGDLHGNNPDDLLFALRSDTPDLITVVGDMSERWDGTHPRSQEHALQFFREASKIAPVIASFGNHDLGANGRELRWHRLNPRCGRMYVGVEILRELLSYGVTLLDDAYEERTIAGNRILIGGLTSGLIHRDRYPNLDWLRSFSETKGFHLLLCHHPEYYPSFIRELQIECTLAGHAHGGQWRLFGRGIYSPGQGIFPRWTHGVYENRLLVTPGAGDSTWIPRIANPHEIPYLTLQ